jgi:hypothetical protein
MDPNKNNIYNETISDELLAEIYASDALLNDIESTEMFVGSQKFKYIDASPLIGLIAPVSEIDVTKYDPKTSLLAIDTKFIDDSFKCIAGRNFFTDKNKKKIIKFERSDGIILPSNTKQKLFESLMTMHTVKLTNYKCNLTAYCRVIGFDAPENTIVIPRWLMDGIFLEVTENVHVNTVNMPEVKSIKVKVDKEIEDPKTILEYELKDHVVSFVGKTIKVKIFEKEYEIKVVSQEPSTCGIISNIDVKLEIE